MNTKLKTQLFKPVTNDYSSYYNIIKSLLNNVKENRLLIVKFSYEVVKDLDKYYDTVEYKDVYEARQVCLKLIEETINKPALLNNKQHKAKLKKATNAAYAVAYATYSITNVDANADANANAAADAAYAAADAAYDAAYAAANAAYDAGDAASAAAYAVNAAANAAAATADAGKYNEAAKLQSIKQSYYLLVEMLMEEYSLGNVKTFKLLYKGN